MINNNNNWNSNSNNNDNDNDNNNSNGWEAGSYRPVPRGSECREGAGGFWELLRLFYVYIISIYVLKYILYIPNIFLELGMLRLWYEDKIHWACSQETGEEDASRHQHATPPSSSEGTGGERLAPGGVLHFQKFRSNRWRGP